MRSFIHHARASTTRNRDRVAHLFSITLTLTLLWALSGLLLPAVGLLIRKSDGKVLSSIDVADILGGRLSLQLVAYVVGFILILGVFSWVISSAARILGDGLRLKGRSMLLLALGIWTISVCWIQLLNDRLYPRSRASYFDPGFATSAGAEWLLYVTGVAMLVAGVVAAALRLRQATAPRRALLLAPAGLLLVALVAFAAPRSQPSGPATGMPNVILIGIDSLRTDRVSLVDQETGLTPNISEFLGSAAVFNRTYTPLARTYPSWMSILTGQYPRTNGVRYNLTPMSSVAREASLAWRFREQGFDTMLAMDERRFANIDAKHGFDTEIGPEMGAGDFLLAPVTDSPLPNLLQATPIGRAIFPFNHVNRAVDRLYHPDRFDRAIAAKIAVRSASRPLFLVAHFCLPHWPYRWVEVYLNNSRAPAQSISSDSTIRTGQRYQKSTLFPRAT